MITAPESSIKSQTAVLPNSPIRPLCWSVRREIWENRSIYLAPIIVAIVGLIGYLLRIGSLPERRRAASLLDPVAQRAAIAMPYEFAAMAIMLTAIIVGVFYSLDALYGERRDRSILFWKSLPVSDLTVVLSKAAMPLIVLPVVTFAIIIGTQLIMLLVSSAVLAINGVSPASTWDNFPFFTQSGLVAYGIAVATLWHAPIYGWLLLVSGWVRRAAFLWAVMPVIMLGVLGKLLLNPGRFYPMVRDRLIGWAPRAFDFNVRETMTFDSMVQITPMRFLSAPGLWIGLAFFVAFLFAAIRVRRYRSSL
jgi:ABC-2 type transport system permease protein